MKILALSFSPRKNGNTEILLNEALQSAQQEGAQTELIRIAENEIKHCDGCRVCWDSGDCHIKDDMQNLYTKLLNADGIIFGTPVYFYSMSGQAKTFIDRTCALGTPGRNLANKVGGVVVVAGSLGLVDILKDLYFYFITRQILPANYVAAYAGNKGEVSNLPKCMTAARDLGRQMVLIAARKFEYPADIKRSGIAYGTHTR